MSHHIIIVWPSGTLTLHPSEFQSNGTLRACDAALYVTDSWVDICGHINPEMPLLVWSAMLHH